MVKCIFTTKATVQQYRIEPNGSVFNSLAPAKGYAQKNCAERFSALKATPGAFVFHIRSNYGIYKQ